MDLHVLGPVEATADDKPVAIGAGKPRALLAMLALSEGTAVSSEALIDGLWGEDPPATANKMVQVYVSQLRKAFRANGNGAEIVTRRHGYELRLGGGEVDALRFERLLADGTPREALALWRGPPLDDVATEPFASLEIRRLEELRLDAVELALQQDLDAGRPAEVVRELQSLIAQEPLRERLHGLLMLALYRLGRQAQALGSYRRARDILIREIGVEPGPELRRLHEAILRQDPALDLPVPAELPPELESTTPLLGRDAELAALREHWRRAQAGHGAVLVLAGEPGMGKTRLAAALAAEVHSQGGLVLYGGDAESAAHGIEHACAARGPALLVLDDGGGFESDVSAVAARRLLVLAIATDAAGATLTLGPLDAAAVAAIARTYPRAPPPLDRLVADSGGVPWRVHRAIRAWLRSEAARRLGASAGRAADERARLQQAQDDLTASVVELQAASERAEPARGPATVACPFKGLASFEVDDADVFFGRERLVAEIVARLAGAPLLGIVGPSGSGKSSALKAGLLPALAHGVLPGSDGWAVALLRPARTRSRRCTARSRAAPVGGRLVLAVDQFEELFTACRDEGEKAAFAAALVAAVRDPTPPRARLDRSARRLLRPLRELSRAVADARRQPRDRRADAPRRAAARDRPARPARRPARRRRAHRRAGGRRRGRAGGAAAAFDRVARAVAAARGRAPRLRGLRSRRRRARRGRAAGRAGLRRAPPDEQPIARTLLERLAGVGDEGQAVRRRLPLADLERVPHAAEVLGQLADGRLVSISQDQAEVAHEALLREWPRLREWLEEDAEGRRLHHHLGLAAREWDAGGRDAGELYRGARLAAAMDWSAAHDPELGDVERAFLDESRAAGSRAQRHLRAVLAGVASLLVLAVIAGLVALQQRGSARDEATTADAQRLGSRALAENDLDRSLLLARQGVALDDSPQTRGNLLAALIKSPAAIGVMRGVGERFSALALSPDGGTLAAGDPAGNVFLFDTRTRRRVTAPDVRAGDWAIAGLAYSPDGRRLAVAHDSTEGHVVRIIDVRGGRLERELDLYDYARSHQRAAVRRLGSSRRREHPCRTREASPRTTVERFDVRTGELLFAPVPFRDTAPSPVLGTRDGQRVLTASADELVIRDDRTLQPRQRIDIGRSAEGRAAGAYALSPDARTAVVGEADGSVRFVDVRSGAIERAAGRHGGPVTGARFTPTGAHWSPRAMTATRSCGTSSDGRRPRRCRVTPTASQTSSSRATGGRCTRRASTARSSPGISRAHGGSAGRSRAAGRNRRVSR